MSTYKMLHEGIHLQYKTKLDEVESTFGVEMIYNAKNEDDLIASPAIARVSGSQFLINPNLHHEVFGPFSMVVACDNERQLMDVLRSLNGQLTTTIMGTYEDLQHHAQCIDLASQIAGRIVFNGVPTGVEVGHATVHGGPYPASTDARFTSVGMDAIQRWVRPICYQDCPDFLLPNELKNSNPLNICRKVDGIFVNKLL